MDINIKTKALLGIVAILIAGLSMATRYATAQESSGQFGAGSVKIGYDNRTCDASLEGTLRYDSGGSGLQFCNGTAWESAGSCSPNPACPNVGDVCNPDGYIFAGFLAYGSSCEALYVTDNNQSAASAWKTSTGVDDISTDSHSDGKINSANRSGAIANFPAFDLCESNPYHGKSDWYLPARAELDLLWQNRTAIDANAVDFIATDYWSSTENNTNNAWDQAFGGGDQGTASKTTTSDVRCVRRD